jgi:NAD(P)H-nitrite reductase large subunit
MKKIDDDLIICRCEEITLGEIRQAVREGANDVSAVKRRTRAGMGLCQGRTCEPMIQGIIKQEIKANNETTGKLTARFPHRPVKFSVLGGMTDEES